jgi:hypothetical protein
MRDPSARKVLHAQRIHVRRKRRRARARIGRIARAIRIIPHTAARKEAVARVVVGVVRDGELVQVAVRALLHRKAHGASRAR